MGQTMVAGSISPAFHAPFGGTNTNLIPSFALSFWIFSFTFFMFGGTLISHFFL